MKDNFRIVISRPGKVMKNLLKSGTGGKKKILEIH